MSQERKNIENIIINIPKNKIPEQYITHIPSSRFKILFVIESAKIIITEENIIEVVISNNKDVRPIESLSIVSCL